MNKCLRHVIEENTKFQTALETNWNWSSNPRQLNTLLDPALKSGRFMSFAVSNLPSSKWVLWRIFVPLFSSSFLFLTRRYSCLGAVLSCIATLTNLSLSLYHHITDFQAYDGSASPLFDIPHPRSIISSKFCFVRLFGLNLMTKQLWCFSDHWNHHVSHFLCKSWKKLQWNEVPFRSSSILQRLEFQQFSFLTSE